MPPIKLTTGFVLLYAVLLVSIVLTVSLSLYNITFRQLVLASTAQESAKAFYLTDAGRQCLRYWNSQPDASHPFGVFSVAPFTNPTLGSITCGGVTINLTSAPVGNIQFTPFAFAIDGGCVQVEARKDRTTQSSANAISIVYGYNIGTVSGSTCVDATNNTRRVERAVDVQL